MSGLKVAIVGAGPSGCTLALLLIKEGILPTIFEGEAALNARGQGGTLDLHDSTGLAAIKRAGLFDDFNKRARYDGESFKVANKDLKLFANFGGTTKENSRGRPEIDRSALREMLIEALPAKTVRWGHRLRRIDDDMTMHFDSGRNTQEFAETGFDLIIGADGTWSKVRPKVSPVNAYYSGVQMTRMNIPDVKDVHPQTYELANRGSLFAYDKQKFLALQQLGEGSMNVGLTWVAPEEELRGLDIQSPEAVKERGRDKFRQFCPELLDAWNATEGAPWAANLYMLPIGHRWTHRPGFTLMGDAAHAMTPFAGEGVNLALADAMSLADAIIKTDKAGKQTLSKHIKAFEADMFVRATKTQQLTYDIMQTLFFSNDSTSQQIKNFLLCAGLDSVPGLLQPVVRAIAEVYFWWYGLNDKEDDKKTV